jgi:hypothetical protein
MKCFLCGKALLFCDSVRIRGGKTAHRDCWWKTNPTDPYSKLVPVDEGDFVFCDADELRKAALDHRGMP